MGQLIAKFLNLIDGSNLQKLAVSRWGLIIGAILEGILLSMSIAPFSMWPLGIIALVFFMLQESSIHRKTLVFLHTLIFFGTYASISLSWIEHVLSGFGELPAALSYTVIILGSFAYVSLPYTIFNTLAFAFSKNHRNVFILCFMPLAFILADFFVSFFLTGFPWLYVGYSCVDGPLKNYAPFIGVTGINVLIYILSAAITLTALRDFLFLPIAAMILALGIFLEEIPQVQREESFKVNLIQANIPQSVHNDGASADEIIGTYWGLTDLENSKAKITIWSESALPLLLNKAPLLIKDLDDSFKDRGMNLVTGIFTTDNRGIYNSIVTLGKDVSFDTIDAYRKRILVPFGEIVPFADLLRPLGSIFVMPNSSFSYGEENQESLKAQGHEFTPAICYEAVFPNVIRTMDNDKTSGIIMISNDSWFGPTKGPLQHLNIARMRAMELQKPMLRDTNSGITAYIDEYGKVISSLKTDISGVLNVDFYPVRGQSIFSRFGFTGTCIIMLVLLIAGIAGIRIRPDENKLKINRLIRP